MCVALSPYRIPEKTTESFNSVVSFESEESSFFCRSSEENRSHLLWAKERKKKIFDSVNMSSYRRPDNPERTLWTEFDEKEDCGVTFSKFSIETCEEMITREEDCDRSAAEKSRRYRTERRVGAKKSSKEEEKGKDTLPAFETTPKTINSNNISFSNYFINSFELFCFIINCYFT